MCIRDRDWIDLHGNAASCISATSPPRFLGPRREDIVVPYRPSVASFCVKSHQIIAGMMVAAVSRPAAAVAARPAFVR